jgi:hypothetical protein
MSIKQYPISRRDVIKKAFAVGAVACALPSANAEVLSLNDAINKAGRQRMLSQRMAKAWLAMGQGIEAQHAEKVMLDSMALFDRQLVELKAYAPTPEIKETYMRLEPVWGNYKTALIGSKPDRSAAAALLDLDAKVLQLAHQGTAQLEQYSGKAVGKLVNMAGRERMLSQRTAKFYLSASWGVNPSNAAVELNTARAEFVRALQTLTNAPQATKTIKQELELAQQQWIFFDHALDQLNETTGATRRAKDVFSTSEHILQIMDKVTGMYTQLT